MADSEFKARNVCYLTMEKMLVHLEKHLRISMLLFYSESDKELGMKTLNNIKSMDIVIIII